MKKAFCIALILLLCAIAAAPAAFAESETAARLDYITDDAGIFSDADCARYEARAKALSEACACGIYFVTLADYTRIAEGEPNEVAEHIYQTYQLGYGDDRDGVLLLVSTAEGDCALVSQGAAREAVGDHQVFLDACVDAYGENGYQDILDAYLARMEAIFSVQTVTSRKAVQAAPDARQKAFVALDGYVTDQYGLLTADEEIALESKAAALSDTFGCGVYVLITDDYTRYGKGSPYDVAGDVFLACDLGEGPEKAGVLLMMSMAERDITILTNEAGHAWVGPDAKDWLAVKYLEHFKKNAWAKGFETYLVKLETVLNMAAQGRPMTWITFPESRLFGVLVAALGGFGVAYCLMGSIRNKMKSVFSAALADAYIAQGGVDITNRADTFSHKTTTRRKIESSSTSGGGSGGSRSSDSRGFSGRSDKF